MIHHRTVMRNRIVEILKRIDIPGINDRVYGTVFFPQRDLPLISVFCDGETVEPHAEQYERRLAVLIKIFAKAGESVEDDVDEYCAAIEAGLDRKLGGLAQNGRLVAVGFDRSGEGNQEYMTADLAYTFDYFTTFRDPSQATN